MTELQKNCANCRPMTVRIQVEDQRILRIVVKLADAPRSYIVRGTSGQEYRHNCKHLKKVDKTVVTLK